MHSLNALVAGSLVCYRATMCRPAVSVAPAGFRSAEQEGCILWPCRGRRDGSRFVSGSQTGKIRCSHFSALSAEAVHGGHAAYLQQ